ncbi:MAG: hypothetical protein M1825_002753 [Sarcosagium campestre]|nr:MAG: hypothetical protein M1825_002753 [Sarcosagium campestre]
MAPFDLQKRGNVFERANHLNPLGSNPIDVFAVPRAWYSQRPQRGGLTPDVAPPRVPPPPLPSESRVEIPFWQRPPPTVRLSPSRSKANAVPAWQILRGFQPSEISPIAEEFPLPQSGLLRRSKSHLWRPETKESAIALTIGHPAARNKPTTEVRQEPLTFFEAAEAGISHRSYSRPLPPLPKPIQALPERSSSLKRHPDIAMHPQLTSGSPAEPQTPVKLQKPGILKKYPATGSHVHTLSDTSVKPKRYATLRKSPGPDSQKQLVSDPATKSEKSSNFRKSTFAGFQRHIVSELPVKSAIMPSSVDKQQDDKQLELPTTEVAVKPERSSSFDKSPANSPAVQASFSLQVHKKRQSNISPPCPPSSPSSVHTPEKKASDEMPPRTPERQIRKQDWNQDESSIEPMSMSTLILDTSPDEEDYRSSSSSTVGSFVIQDGGIGPSLRKVDRLVRQLVEDDKSGKRELHRTRKVVVQGSWVDVPNASRMMSAVIVPHKRSRTNVGEPMDKGMRVREKRRVSDLRKRAKSSRENILEDDEAAEKEETAQTEPTKSIGGGPPQTPSKCPRRAEEIAISFIILILSKLEVLEEMSWVTALPFSAALWGAMPTNSLRTLTLDLFKYFEADSDVLDSVPPIQLEGLRAFSQMYSLTVTGMLESYQKEIWEAVWCFPHLKRLELRMAIAPDIRRPPEPWSRIENDWTTKKPTEVTEAYHGENGRGTIHTDIGYGQYLDALVMRRARHAMVKGQSPVRISIEMLALSGFVVDSQPFYGIFNPRTLHTIEFTQDCIDAGFYLHPEMMGRTRIRIPKGDDLLHPKEARMYKASDVKVISLPKR